jgi:hypothetical protein
MSILGHLSISHDQARPLCVRVCSPLRAECFRNFNCNQQGRPSGGCALIQPDDELERKSACLSHFLTLCMPCRHLPLQWRINPALDDHQPRYDPDAQQEPLTDSEVLIIRNRLQELGLVMSYGSENEGLPTPGLGVANHLNVREKELTNMVCPI